MSAEAIIRELFEQLENAEWLSDEERAELEDFLSRFRDESKALEESQLDEENLNRWRNNFRQGWEAYFLSCQHASEAEYELLIRTAKVAESARELALALIDTTSCIKKALESGDHEWTWEHRDAMAKLVAETEEILPSLLERLTAEDIRQLKNEGVI